MKTTLITYQDAIDHALDYLGGATDAENERYARRAILLAANDFWSKRNWVYFYSRDRTHTSAPYQTGTIAFDLTGGAQERMVTLTGGTWPSWAADGVLIIGDIPYNVSSRISNSVIQLATATAPAEDIAAGTEYVLAQDRYTMPVDFGAMGEVIASGHARLLGYQPPDVFMRMHRTNNSVGNPHTYTLMGDPRRYGVLSMYLFPPPDAVYPLDFTYRRKPRNLNVIVYSEGTVAITSGSLVLTGTNTLWTSNMVGSVVRFGDAENIPTGSAGAQPFVLERTIAAYTSASSLTLDQDPGQTLTAVKHAISDPVDMETGAMMTYFFREVEKQCRILRRMKPVGDEERHYVEAMLAAFEADSRHFESRATFSGGVYPTRLADMPVGSDIE